MISHVNTSGQLWTIRASYEAQQDMCFVKANLPIRAYIYIQHSLDGIHKMRVVPSVSMTRYNG
jgi:hypothetical protein